MVLSILMLWGELATGAPCFRGIANKAFALPV